MFTWTICLPLPSMVFIYELFSLLCSVFPETNDVDGQSIVIIGAVYGNLSK